MASGRLFSLFLRRSGPRANDLGKMTLPELVVAYATYPTIILYAVLFLAAVAGAVWLGAAARPARTLLTVATAVVVYPFAEYLLHRYVLHARWLYKNPLTADLWRRIHYDHHQDPNRLDVLFGSPSNTLPAMFLISLPIGWALGGLAMALVALATALVLFSIYEFCHCVQHLNYVPKSAWLRAIKKNHMAHHFHNETGNFGITTNIVDRIVGSFYASSEQRPRSPTTYNLGYDEGEAARYPWVAERSGPARARPGAR
jgi:sterol desaturase/sphingolipid hydroxylase (fatty acid hydroxylase superfamily)